MVEVLGRVEPIEVEAPEAGFVEDVPGASVEVLGMVRPWTTEEIKTRAAEEAEEFYKGILEREPTGLELSAAGALGVDPTEVAKAQVEMLKEEQKSPYLKAFAEGIRSIPIPTPYEGMPGFEETFGRKKTLGEKATELGGTLLADLPLIIGAEVTTGLMAAKLGVNLAAKHLATRALVHGARAGATGTIYHTATDFADQMFNPDEESFDYGRLLGEGVKGFGLWGTVGFLGPVAGRALGKTIQKLSKVKQFLGFDKVATRAENSSLKLSKMADEATVKAYGQPMVEITGPGGFRKVVDSTKTANQFIKNVEGAEAMRHAKVGMWEEYHQRMAKAWAAIEGMYIETPEMVAAAEAGITGRVVGNIPSLTGRVENAVFSPKNLRKLHRGAIATGKTLEEAGPWMYEQLEALRPLRLFTGFVEPLMECERMSRRYTPRMLRWITKNVVKPIRMEARLSGKSELSIAENCTMWLEAAARRETTNPEIVVNFINRTRRQLADLPELIVTRQGRKMTPIEAVRDRINMFVKKHQFGEGAAEELERLVAGTGAGRSVEAEYITRRFGAKLRARPSLYGLKRMPSVADFERAGVGGARARRVLRDLEKLPKVDQEAIVKELGTVLNRVEDIERLYNMSANEIAIARRARQGFDAMFNAAGIDPADYMAFYATHRASSEVMTMESLYHKMKKFPLGTKRRYKFMVEMHRQNEKFIADKDVRTLLIKYAWGAGRAKYMNETLNRVSKDFLESKLLSGTPLWEVMNKFHQDMYSGMSSRTNEAVFRGLHSMSRGAVPYEVWKEFSETVMSNIYGATMGLRPWLLARNMTQPWLTTAIVTGYGPLTKAYLDIGNLGLLRDFLKQGIHMQRGGGLPFADEMFKELGAMEGVSGWLAVRRVLNSMRKANYWTTRPYQLSDTLNRYISYRAAIHMIEDGLTAKHVNPLVARVIKQAKKVPKRLERGKVKLSDMRKSRYRESRNIAKSKEMDKLMRATGINRSFLPAIVEDYKDRLATMLMGGEISGKVLTETGGVWKPFIEKTPRSVKNAILEAFRGEKGTLQKALKTVSGDEWLGGAVQAGFKDGFAKRAARKIVGDTQWLYDRKMQAKWIQSRVFGMYGTWSSNFLRFLNNHLFRIGTGSDKVWKAAQVGGFMGTMYAALSYAGISPTYLWRSFAVPTGGPLMGSLYDAVKITSLGIPEYEKRAAAVRLKRDIPEYLIPGPREEVRSIYQAYKGEKPPVLGILGAPMTKKQRSAYQRPTTIQWNMKKLTAARVKRIEKLLRELKEAESAIHSGNAAIRDAANRVYVDRYYELRHTVQAISMYAPGDPRLLAQQVLDEWESKKK